MTQKSLQTPNLQLNSPSQLHNPVTHMISPEVPKMKEEQPHDQRESKLCNEEQAADGNASASKREWTPEEDQLVYQLHNQFGNKWAIIAEQLKGRTDNCIKNHFYSRLRKGLRKINKLIEDCYSKIYKEFKIIDLYKVIEASDEKFKQFNSCPNEMTDFGHDLKNRLFIFAEEESDGTQQFESKAKKLLDDLNQFRKNYKRKSKKSRRYSPMGVGSVYRNNKKQSQPSETMQTEQQKTQNPVEEKVKKEPVVKVEEVSQKRQRKQQPRRQAIRHHENRTEITIVPIKKQVAKQITLPELMQVVEENPLSKAKGKNTYRQFSDDEGEEKDEADYLKEQRLNHFAQNILKTFKSYYSFKSFKSNPMMDDFIFQ